MARSRASRWLDFACILPGAGFAAWMVGNLPQAIAPWLAALFTLRFVRTAPARIGLPVGALGWAIAFVIGWDGVLPFRGWLTYAVPAAAGMVYFLPFVVDRAMAARLPTSVRWLVLPSAWVVMEFLFGLAGFGSWGAVAYSQAAFPLVLQTLAVVGLAGPAFLVGAFASCANEVWAQPGSGRRIGLAGLLAGGCVLALGALRLEAQGTQEATVRVAGVVVDNMPVFRDTWGPLSYGKVLDADAAERVRPQADALLAELFRRSEQAVRDGARIVVWSEGNALVFKAHEAGMVAAGQAFAARHRIYLFMAAAVMEPGKRLAENIILLVDPRGRIIDRYLKSHPTPGEMSQPGDGRMRVLATPYGRLAWAICYDFDYPRLIRQAGRQGADILIDPSWDSPAMAPLHSRMAALRSIENGAALFRPVNDGLSVAVDAHGRTLASMSPADARVRNFIVDLPRSGVSVLQPWWGDGMAYACLLLLLALGRGRKANSSSLES